MKARRIIWLWAALAALLAGSCVQKQVPEDDGWLPLGGDNVPVSFGAGVVRPATRTYSSLSGIYTSFRVFAFLQPGDPDTDYTGSWADVRTRNWTPNFMYNQQVNWVTDHWEYTPVKYWPNNPENTVTFWAYAPADAPVTLYRSGSSTAYSNSTPGLPSVRFTVPATADSDFMLSVFDMVKDHTLNPDYPGYFTQDLSKKAIGESVNFLFNHALCKVDIRASKEDEDDDYDIVLTDVSFRDILFTGVKVDGGWAAGTTDRYDLDVLESGNIALTDSNQNVSTGNILMPQILWRTAATLYVKYKCKNKLAVDYTTYESEVDLGDVLDSWDMSKVYTITLRISPGSPILFTASVAHWASDTNGYFNVNGDE